jgi:phosphoglucosamine mutase
MPEWFGTDGLRGKAGQFPLDEPTVFNLGQALVVLLGEKNLPPLVLIGRDTRESSPWLENVLRSGIVSAGGRVDSAGVIPTSAISLLTRDEKFSAGIVISASHNPYDDNGIKIFQPNGTKIPEDWEDYLEEKMTVSPSPPSSSLTDSPPLNPEKYYQDKYCEFLKSCFRSSSPAPLKIVIDCAHGASSAYAPRLFSELGFEVIPTACSPTGQNINLNCGSLHPQQLARQVVEHQADLGIAYDGDADRAIWVDRNGQILNGDHTLYVLARYFQKKNTLSSDKIVATVMSNLGLEKALECLNLKLIRTRVGDKYVLEKMLAVGSNLGGERSGHTIILDECPTGDGLLTSLKILEAVSEEETPLDQLIAGYTEYPQILINIPAKRKPDLATHPEAQAILEEAQQAMTGKGRIFTRYSGTEPVLRLLLEGKDKNLLHEWGEKLRLRFEKILN